LPLNRDALADLSGDGRRAAAVAADGLRVWDITDGKVMLHRADLTNTSRVGGFGHDAVRLSSDGGRVVFARAVPMSPRFVLTTLDVGTGGELSSVDLGRRHPHDLCFGPDGSRLAAVTWEMVPDEGQQYSRRQGLPRLDVYDAVAGKNLYGIDLADAGSVGRPQFTADGRRVAVSVLRYANRVGNPLELDATTVVLDATTGARLSDLPPTEVTSQHSKFAFNPDGGRMAVVVREARPRADRTSSRPLQVVDTSTSRSVWSVTVPATIDCLCFSPDGRLLAGYGSYASQVVHVWDAETGIERLTLRGHTTPVQAVAFGPDGGRLVSLDQGGTIKTWDLTVGPGKVRLPRLRGTSPRAGPNAVTFDGRRMAVVNDDRLPNGREVNVRVYDDSGRELLNRTLAPSDQESRVPNRARIALSPDGAKVAVFVGTNVVVWGVDDGQELFRIKPLGSDVGEDSLTFSPDGRTIAVATVVRDADRRVSGSLALYDVATGQLVRSLPLEYYPINPTFSPDGRRLAVGVRLSPEGEPARRALRVFDLVGGVAPRQFELHVEASAAVAFSPDGRWLTAAGEEGIAVWDTAADAQQRRVLTGHSSRVTSLAFSPDGRRLASVAAAGLGIRVQAEVKVWDPASGRELLAPASPAGLYSPNLTVRFTADGSALRLFDPQGYTEISAAPLPPGLEAPDVADRVLLPPEGADPAAPLAELALAPELRTKAAELVRARAETIRRAQTAPAAAPPNIFTPLVVVYQTGQPEAEYRQALAEAERRIAAGGPGPSGLFFAGAAHYRLGQYEEALKMLTRLEQERPTGPTGPPFPAAFRAMTYHRQGNAEKAREALAEMRLRLAANPAATGYAKALCAEAEALIDPKK